MINLSWVEAAIVASLAVNSYPAERAWALREELKAEGITDGRVRGVERIAEGLERAGYTRGDYITGLVALRVEALWEAFDNGLASELPEIVTASERERTLEVLQRVKGVGPRVAEMTWLLMASAS